jgi:hypothetical protein
MPDRTPERPKGEYFIRLLPKADGPMGGIGKNANNGEGFSFESFPDMVRTMEDNMDKARHPQHTMNLRAWEGKKMDRNNKTRHPEEKRGKIITLPNGANFVIRVQYRQNASWQGTIQWLEGKQTLRYRSVLELLKLMEDAVQRTEGLHAEPAPTWND